MSSESPSVGRFPAIIAWTLHLLPWALVAAELICVGVYAAHARTPRKINPSSPAVLANASSTPSSEAANPSGFFTSAEFPEGRLFITAARGAYQDGDMQLSVSKLGAEDLPVRKTSDDAVLKSEVGLSEFSQLPAEDLGNVIILGWGGFAAPPESGVTSDVTSGETSDVTSGATSGETSGETSGATSGETSGAASDETSGAASDVTSQPAPFTPRDGRFKELETLSFGDTATLTYAGTRYSYAYKDTQTFEEDDWAPLYIQGFNCLSLVSPVGNGQSVVVRFELTGTEKL